MTDAQRAVYAAQIDRIYDNFISAVASGRRIPPDRVREIAAGRVWTGVQAKRLGLVDDLGRPDRGGGQGQGPGEVDQGRGAAGDACQGGLAGGGVAKAAGGQFGQRAPGWWRPGR